MAKSDLAPLEGVSLGESAARSNCQSKSTPNQGDPSLIEQHKCRPSQRFGTSNFDLGDFGRSSGESVIHPSLSRQAGCCSDLTRKQKILLTMELAIQAAMSTALLMGRILILLVSGIFRARPLFDIAR